MSTDTYASSALMPRMVDLALRRLTDQQAKAFATDTPVPKADRLARIAELYRREARWWDVLARWTYSEVRVPLVFGKAAIYAKCEANEHATHYEELAASARRRAALDTSGVAA